MASRTKKHFADMKRAKSEAKHNYSRNKSTDAPRIPSSSNPPNVRALLQSYVPSTEAFFGVTFSGNRKPLVYKSQEKANVKYRVALQKRKKNPKVQE